MVRSSDPRFPLIQLRSDLDVRGFTSGNHPGSAEIDEYLRTSALVEQEAGLSQVWIAFDPEAHRDDRVAAYFTLSPLSIPLTPIVLDALRLESVPYRAVGGYLLGRLGVSSRLQGQQLGGSLVAAAIKIAQGVRSQIGGAFLAVDPKNDGLLAWYERLDFGFRRLDPTKRRIMLKL
jgi:ribosomal protein S18 acetylase RimI-like enzyme